MAKSNFRIRFHHLFLLPFLFFVLIFEARIFCLFFFTIFEERMNTVEIN